MIGVEKGRHGPPCDPVRCPTGIKGNCDRGSGCEYLQGNLEYEVSRRHSVKISSYSVFTTGCPDSRSLM